MSWHVLPISDLTWLNLLEAWFFRHLLLLRAECRLAFHGLQGWCVGRNTFLSMIHTSCSFHHERNKHEVHFKLLNTWGSNRSVWQPSLLALVIYDYLPAQEDRMWFAHPTWAQAPRRHKRMLLLKLQRPLSRLYRWFWPHVSLAYQHLINASLSLDFP